VPRLSTSLRRNWFGGPDMRDSATLAAFNNDRYAIPITATGSIAAAEHCRKGSASFTE
jgi:hypothetical protein